MSLEIELDCDGLSSKQDELGIDTEESGSVLRTTDHDDLKDLESEEDDGQHHGNKRRRDSINHDNVNYYNLDIIKQKELMQHLEELKREYAQKIDSLESNLERVQQQNENYESQLTALRQHNEYLTEASNQWQTRYKDTNLQLQSAREDIINLQTELTNLQLSYEEDVKQIKTDHKIILDQTSEDNEVNQELQHYMKENLVIRKENKKYLDQLKQINNKYRESNTKYDDLLNIQMDLQNELNILKAKNAELNDIVQEYFHEIQSLEQNNAELKQTMGELQTTTKGLYDEDGNAIEVSYNPDAVSRRKKGFRRRSHSEVSAVSAVSYNDSVCDSPIVSNGLNGDNSNFQYALAHLQAKFDDIYDDDNLNASGDDKSDEFNDSASDQMERFYDLYEAMNDYLFQLSECVQTIKTIKLLHKRRSSMGLGLARTSSHTLSTKFRKEAEEEQKEKEKEKEKGKESEDEVIDDRLTDDELDSDTEDDGDDDDDDGFTETLNIVLDNNEEQTQLARMHDVIQQSKEIMTELQKQQMVVMDEERTKREDLDAAYKHYQIKTKRKMKRMTKDMYSTQYKKYGGYRQICWEMVGNVGSYTKEAIIYKLTH